jgi:hypothetical protein
MNQEVELLSRVDIYATERRGCSTRRASSTRRSPPATGCWKMRPC